jgi:hypothetical protein
MIRQTIDGSILTQALQLKMNLTRVLLSIEHQLHAQLLKHSLLTRDDVELVGETKGLVESLMLIAAHKPDLWIHSLDSAAESSATLSHAHSIHPGLAILRVHPDEPTGLLQLQVNSLSELIEVATRTRPPLSSSGLETAGNSP